MQKVVQMKCRKILSFLLLLSLSLTLIACDKQPGQITPRTKQYYEYFDTVSVIFSYADETDEEFESHTAIVRDVLSEYHKLFDIYYEYSGINNLKTVNKNAGKEPVKVDEKMIDFLLYAKEIYTLTDGETNIAMGSVLKLWHDCREEAEFYPDRASVPTEEELTRAAEHINIDDLVIDTENSTVYLRDPNMRLDVGAIGKGYATERAREALVELDVSSYVLNIGGNISAIGEKPDGKGWKTSVTNPDRESDEPYVVSVDLRDTACVTSGNYERYYTVGGVRYHHIIDKDTLMPSEHFASVTVFTKDSALADALSTALFSTSYEDGLSLVNEIGDVDVLWVTNDGSMYMTDGVREIIIE